LINTKVALSDRSYNVFRQTMYYLLCQVHKSMRDIEEDIFVYLWWQSSL